MTDAIAHRGPDDYGYYGWNEGPGGFWKDSQTADAFSVGLGFRRLSILDLSSRGAQPMASADGRYWLVFNGQIYNHVEIKASLGDVAWRSRSDTEVLLELLARDGADALPRLNGMFALAFFDSVTGSLLLARDPVGIKPLYYFIDERGLFFGSEIRALLPALPGRPPLRTELLARHLTQGWLADPDTLYDGIFRVRPGHSLTFERSGRATENRFWDFEARPDRSADFGTRKNRLRETLDDALLRQLQSDVPVGFFLSGGVDSSLLTARASQLLPAKPLAFSVGLDWKNGATDADLRASRVIGGRFAINREEILLKPSVVDLLPKVVDVLEEPLADAAAICSYLICEAAKSKVKVLISGQGADEVFGGYPIYQPGRIAASLQRMPQSMNSLLALSAQLMPYSVARRPIQTVHRLRKVLASTAQPWPEPFLALRSLFQPAQLTGLLVPELIAAQQSPYGRHMEMFEQARGWDHFSQMLYLDLKTYLPALNLAYSDKTSMAHSLELRVPFLDQKVLEFAEALPSRYKATLNGSKILLKAAAEETLPRSIVRRKKAGFGVPLREWFVDELQPMAADLLAPGRLRRQGLFRPEVPMQWLKEHRERRADHCTKLYALMTLQLWLD